MSIFIFAQSFFGQTADSLTFFESRSPSSLSSLFDKRLNTYSLNSRFNYSNSFGNYSFTIFENFRSTVTKATPNSIKDENYLTISNRYSISKFLAFGIMLNNNTFSDDRRLSINKTSVMHGQIFADFQPAPEISLIPYGGISQNQQVAVLDKGVIYGSEANVTKLRFDDFVITGNAKFHNEDITPRKNTLRLVNIDLLTDIETDISNNFSVRFTEQRRDFYFESDSVTANTFGITNNIQSRTEDQYQLQNRLLYFSPVNNFSLDLNGRVFWRTIDRSTRYIVVDKITQSSFDTKIEEFKIDLNTSASYSTSDFKGGVRLNYSEKEEKHSPKQIDGANPIFFKERENIETQKNNSAKLITLAAEASYDLSGNDHLSLSMFHRKLVYDTPSDLNFDDRDELLTSARIMYLRNLNYFFDLFINFEGSINKIVYIFAERSSNNNVKRFIKLSSGGIYKSKNVISSNSAEVSANYTVYDYEDLNPNFKSYSFRQLAFRDSTIIKFSRKLKSEIHAYLKISEQGDFKWNNFSNQPVRYLQEIYAEPKFFYSIGQLELGLGIRLFELSTYNYNDKNEKELSSRYTSIGPLTDIRLLMNDSLRLKVYGYYEFISTESSNKSEQANLNIQVDWLL